jgi:hypothetical protein
MIHLERRKPTGASIAWDRNFFMVERWHGTQVEEMLFGGNRLEKAREIFDDAVKKLRQRARALKKWPNE